MGLGSLTKVSLADARSLAETHRAALGRGEDPIDTRKVTSEIPTFGDSADEYVADKSAGWSNEKHRWQWKTTLEVQAAPLRPKKITDVTAEDVYQVLKPIWDATPETATRLRGRIEKVLSAAFAKLRPRGIKVGENPARWKDNLEHRFNRRKKSTQRHYPAVPFAEMPAFVTQLRQQDGVSAKALEFLTLTVTRSNEARGAKWCEIDKKAKVWIIPGERMKMKIEHRVPLTGRALEILEEMERIRVSEYIFPGKKRNQPLSDMSLVAVMRRMDVEAVPHGMRSSFRDWAGEMTNFPRDLAEVALAHLVGDEVERAYRRGDALEKRRKMMEAWARYLSGGASVVSLTAVPA